MIHEFIEEDGTLFKDCHVEGVRRPREAITGTRQRLCFLKDLEMGGRTANHLLCNCFLEGLIADRDTICFEAFRGDQHVECMDDGFTTLTLL